MKLLSGSRRRAHRAGIHQLKRFSLAVLALLVCASIAAATRRERRIDSWQPVHYDVAVSFNDALSEITQARVTILIVCLKDSVSTIDLDFADLPVESVAVNEAPAKVERGEGKLIVILPKTASKGTRLVVSVDYHGKPKDGLILTVDKAGRPSAIGDNWPDRLHHWIPSLDHPSAKATINFKVTAPARDLVVANGKLVQIDHNPRARTWYYEESVPIPPYCMIVAVGEFAKIDPNEQTLTPLSYYVPETDKHLALAGFAPANPSLKFFSQTIAPYPYEKLAMIVGATRFGGMENSSVIVFGNNVFRLGSNSEPQSKSFNIRMDLVSLVAHEIAHQWFGDSVTESTWADLWLSEGFATYFAGLFIRNHDGDEAFQAYMKAEAQSYFEFAKRKRTPIHDTETETLFELLNANNYQKGAWVLHMLRAELGDQVFYDGLRSYYARHKNSIASSEDLRSALEKISRRDLKRFFASWVYGPGHPRYELKWNWNAKSRKLKLSLSQLQPEPAFPNAVEVEVVTPAGKRRVIFESGSKQAVEEIKLRGAPQQVVLDPDDDILDEDSNVKKIR